MAKGIYIGADLGPRYANPTHGLDLRAGETFECKEEVLRDLVARYPSDFRRVADRADGDEKSAVSPKDKQYRKGKRK